MNPRIARAIGVLSVTGMAVVPTAACSSHRATAGKTPHSPGVAVSSSASVDPSASVGPSAPGGGTGAGGGGATGAPVSRACTASDVRLAQQPGGDAAGGTVVVAIALTNRSGTPCSVNGYPSFTLASGAGSQDVTVQRGGSGIPALGTPPAPVTLDPSGQAGFLVVYLNRPQGAAGTCTAVTTMALRLGTATVSGPVQISLCGAPLKVSPYVPGGKLSA